MRQKKHWIRRFSHVSVHWVLVSIRQNDRHDYSRRFALKSNLDSFEHLEIATNPPDNSLKQKRTTQAVKRKNKTHLLLAQFLEHRLLDPLQVSLQLQPPHRESRRSCQPRHPDPEQRHPPSTFSLPRPVTDDEILECRDPRQSG